MSPQVIVAGLVALGIGALIGAAVLSGDSDEKQRREALAAARRRKLERDQRDKAEAMKLDGTHLYKRSFYKPAAAYIAPEKPEQPKPANVREIRKVKR